MPSKSLFEILSGILDISKHSRLENYSLAAHFLSSNRFCLTKLSLTLLVTKSSDSIFVNLSFKEVKSELIFANRLSNLL